MLLLGALVSACCSLLLEPDLDLSFFVQPIRLATELFSVLSTYACSRCSDNSFAIFVT